MPRSALIDARVIRHGRVRFVAVRAGSGARERCEETTTRGTDRLKELELAARARGEFCLDCLRSSRCRGARERSGETRDAMRARGMMTDDFVLTSRARVDVVRRAVRGSESAKRETESAG